MEAFPPGKGGGKGVARGYKGKGVLIHSLVDQHGMPLACSVTPANGSERGQVFILLDQVSLRSGKVGRPRKRPKQLAADKGYDSKALRSQLRKRGIRPEIPKRVWKKRRKPRGRKLQKKIKRYVVERTFAWYQRKFRRLVVRWERLPSVFNGFVSLGFISLGFIYIWLEKLFSG